MKPVLLLETSDVALLPLVKSVLDAAEIPFTVEGEETLGLFPLVGVGKLFGRKPVCARILVPEDRLEEARILLEQGVNHEEGEEP